MKKMLSMMLIMASFVCLTACSEEDEDDFNYPMKTLYGTWEGTDVQVGGEWIDITSYEYEVKSLSNNKAHLYMSDGSGEKLEIKVQKK